ncbi:MAG: single-stranded-DNA-specific exonuclease RecJ [Anaerolineae bacterium]|nr:single-stranded-DNA-specific exonuclease RecJ [Anaerolineae bacterium]
MAVGPKRWIVAPPAPASHLARFPNVHPLVVQVLYNRGITDPADAVSFLKGEGQEGNPFSLCGVGEAVTRLRRAIRAAEPIAVYGDFDADGVTATALLVQTLRELGGNAHPYIPHRVDEGYGLNKEALTHLARLGVRVVVTVDCGVRSLEEAAYARKLGLDLIITDHHSVGAQLPNAVAVVNPRMPHRPYPFGELAGVGVAFKLAQGLLRSNARAPLKKQAVSLEEEDLLDLVALGTVADLVPLLGENRSLVHRGLALINRMERPGIEALCRQSGLRDGAVNTEAISYALGPRLNAAGRMDHARIAYQLLETAYLTEAEMLAAQLDHLNQQRRRLTLEMYERAREIALAAAGGAPLLFAAAPDFPAGIVGLVASKLTDEFYRPTVIVETGPEFSRGSARSIPEFHITEALDECADLLIRHGGHAAAAGFTIATQKLERLAERLRHLAAERLVGLELTPLLSIDAEIKLSQLSWELVRQLLLVEPCGCGNPRPLFLSRNVQLRGQKCVGGEGQHLRLAFLDNGITWDGIAFKQGEWAGKLPDRVDIVYHVEINEWNGEQRIQLNIQDIRPANMEGFIPWP